MYGQLPRGDNVYTSVPETAIFIFFIFLVKSNVPYDVINKQQSTIRSLPIAKKNKNPFITDQDYNCEKLENMTSLAFVIAKL